MKLTHKAAGTFAIAPTPFHDDGRIDEKSIDRLTDFYAEVGCDGVTVLYAGRTVEAGATREVLARPLHPYTQALMRIATAGMSAGARASERLPTIAGESPDPGCLPGGCRFEPRCSERMEVCSLRYPQAFSPEPTRPVNCFKYGE